MHLKSFVALVAVVIALPAGATNFTADSNHTYPSFEVSHFGFSVFRGKFDKTTGKATLDRATKKGSVEVSTDVASVDTGNAKLNDHLRSPDFFDVAMYPTVTFKSNDFKFEGDKLTTVNGQLTIRDVTRPVTLTVRSLNCGPHPLLKKEACGVDAYTTIKRSDYGMKYGLPGLGDEVKIALEMEAISE
jgi:polyisoprenoid-binding protein YceI